MDIVSEFLRASLHLSIYLIKLIHSIETGCCEGIFTVAALAKIISRSKLVCSLARLCFDFRSVTEKGKTVAVTWPCGDLRDSVLLLGIFAKIVKVEKCAYANSRRFVYIQKKQGISSLEEFAL